LFNLYVLEPERDILSINEKVEESRGTNGIDSLVCNIGVNENSDNYSDDKENFSVEAKMSVTE